jgi:hypothetical protein
MYRCNLKRSQCCDEPDDPESRTKLGRFDEALAVANRALEFARRRDRPFALVGSFAAIGRAYL